MRKKLNGNSSMFTGIIFMILSFAGPSGVLANHSKKVNNYFPTAQIITGKIIDDGTGIGLSGATVLVQGSNSTTSDAKGNYSIKVENDNAVLIFSYVGYTSQEIAVNGKTVINVALKTSSTELSQVVVGYGTQRKRDVTGAVKSVKSESFNRGIINSPEQLLQGKVAGVNVTSASGEPGAVLSITVRGPGGVRTGSTPLFVVDGLALDNSSTGGGNPLNFLNPQDIETIDVLKDASATAIYGSRGANGVILITTKKGKAGVANITLGTSYGISNLAGKLPVFSTDQYKIKVVEAGGILNDKGGSTDWQNEITRAAKTKNYNLTLSGGADKLTYYASFGLQQQQGILKLNDFNRYNGRFNLTQKFLEDRLTVEANLSTTSTTNNRPPIGTMIGSAISNNPTYAAYDLLGQPAQYTEITNPLQALALNQDITKINRIVGSITASLKIAKGLVYKINYGIDNSTGTRDIQALPNLIPLILGRLDTYYTTNRNSLIENYLTYSFMKGDHNFSALAGHSYQKIFLQGRNYSINKFAVSPVQPQYNPGLGQDLTLTNNAPGGYAIINELQSFFGRVNYQYKNRYLATVNMRTDGSTKFGANNKYGLFPSFSLGWKIAEESFMDHSIFSNLKLRAGWGRTGNQEIPSKITQALYTTSVTSTNSYPLSATGPYPAGTIFNRLANPNIQWEVSSQTNVGLDFGFLGGKLNGSIDVFNKTSSNILLEVPPADPIQPASTTWTNVKDMQINNKGIEADIEYKVTSRTGVSYSIGGNATIIKNNVTHSPYSVIASGSASGSGLTSATINGYINNHPIGTFYLLDFIGFDANGINQFRDVDGDGIITDKDRITAGTALPNLTYNFYGTMGYKGFDVIVNFNGVSGNKIYDNTANSNFYKAHLVKGLNTTPEAIASPEESMSNPAPVSTRYLKSGAYLRLNNLSLGYTFNTSNLHINKWISALRLSLTGQNLFIITKYNGYDPEVNSDQTINGISSYGIDYLSYPKARSFILGLNVSF
ncbi:SusC/RagA family TonB-linked outer membrane protein [Ferruginibacter sp.]|uniref:SusC/RagA family TonB-linked outer membrane protein n=1 Tax=Ferruginibacter sp. TaxID=1940288 RepID=UPI00265A3586|nr:SusC/RagA family TonB-linked outer membrane protein [Ferruginibacter sp.]